MDSISYIPELVNPLRISSLLDRSPSRLWDRPLRRRRGPLPERPPSSMTDQHPLEEVESEPNPSPLTQEHRLGLPIPFQSLGILSVVLIRMVGIHSPRPTSSPFNVRRHQRGLRPGISVFDS